MKKVVIGLVIFLCFSSTVNAINFGDIATSSSLSSIKNCTKAMSPGAITQAFPGNIEWVDIQSSVVKDGKEAAVDSHSKNHIKDVSARLILADGTMGSTDESSGNTWTETSQYISYGGDLWDANLTSGDVNDPDFGFAFQIGGGITNSYVLKATNFGFHIPPASSITGVTVEVKRREAVGENTIGYVDHITMSVCYTSPGETITDTFPLILTTIGDLKTIRVAPGELLTIPMKMRTVGNMQNAMMQYQIRNNDQIVVSETRSVTSSAAGPYETIQIPQNTIPGMYEIAGSFQFGGRTVPDVLELQFIVENKIGGIFISQLMYGAGILLGVGIVLIVISGFVVYRRRKEALSDYSDIPEPARMYYEMIADVVAQMHDAIGDKAYKMADAVPGLSIDKATGKIINITKDPSEVASVLLIKYQNVFKKKLKISARSKNKKVLDDASAVKKNLDAFEKYFDKK